MVLLWLRSFSHEIASQTTPYPSYQSLAPHACFTSYATRQLFNQTCDTVQQISSRLQEQSSILLQASEQWSALCCHPHCWEIVWRRPPLHTPAMVGCDCLLHCHPSISHHSAIGRSSEQDACQNGTTCSDTEGVPGGCAAQCDHQVSPRECTLWDSQ